MSDTTSTAIPSESQSDYQQDLIRKAKRAYLITLNEPRDGMSALRLAVYLEAGEGLSILWPQCKYENDKPIFSDLLPYQVHTERRNYPAFHFSLSGCGYSKSFEISSMLKRINPSIEVFTLSGFSPSHCA